MARTFWRRRYEDAAVAEHQRMDQFPDLSRYTVCILATILIGWWLWRTWRGAGD